MRQKKREVKIGNVTIGGSNPIAVQTMLNVPVEDIEGNVAQAKRCEAAGCQILRVTCPSPADAKCIEAVKNAVNIPIVADIHFDYKAALACADVGVDKIRINPGNIGDDDRVKAVVDACQQKNIPIRIGVNGGSLEKHILARYGAPTPEAMVESALYHVRLLEKFDFNNIVISIKNSNVPRMMEAYRQLSAVTDYPLHVGVTEAGTYQMGLLKSGMGIGGMLLEGIGDTIRVSLAAEPEKEVEAGFNILRAVGFPVTGPEVITCPTCGRTQYPCTEIANEVEKRLQGYKKSIKVAVMGCVVNGPGEAREADIGIAGGEDCGVLFVKGELKERLPYDELLPALLRYVEGNSLTGIYAMRSLGIDPATGRELFMRRDGSTTFKWDPAENVLVGDTEPTMSGSFGASVYWKGFTLDTYFMYEWGGQRYNQTLRTTIEMADILNSNCDRRVLSDRWIEGKNIIARFRDIKDFNSVTRPTSRLVQDYSYLNLSSLSVGYEFKRDMIRKLGLYRLKLQFNCRDLFTASSIQVERGLTSPYARSFTLSVNASF